MPSCPPRARAVARGGLRWQGKNMKNVAAVLAAVVMFGTAARALGDDSFACPARVEVEQQPVKVPDGWQVAKGEPSLDLTGVEVYDGPLADDASLVPEQKKARRELTSTWRFPAERPREFWLACVYGTNALRLARAVPADTSRCTAV